MPFITRFVTLLTRNLSRTIIIAESRVTIASAKNDTIGNRSIALATRSHSFIGMILSPLQRVSATDSRNRSQNEVCGHVSRNRAIIAFCKIRKLLSFFCKVRTVISRVIRNHRRRSHSSVRNLTPLFTFIEAFHMLARRRSDIDRHQLTSRICRVH